MHKNELLWCILFDGIIADVEGEIPGRVIFTIEIDYLRKMFSEDGSNIIIKLSNCDLLEIRPDQTKPVVRELDLIEKGSFKIFGAEQIEDRLIVFYNHLSKLNEKSGSNLLKLRYKDFKIFLDNGKEISLDELEQKADQYWDGT
jgi:hypothetical protein